MKDKDHVVFFSGGMSSWATAKRVAEKHGTKNLKMLFTEVTGQLKNGSMFSHIKERGCYEMG